MQLLARDEARGVREPPHCQGEGAPRGECEEGEEGEVEGAEVLALEEKAHPSAEEGRVEDDEDGEGGLVLCEQMVHPLLRVERVN